MGGRNCDVSLRGEKEERRVRGVKEGRYSAIPSHADCIIHAGHAGLCCVALRCVALRCVALRCVVLCCVALRCVALCSMIKLLLILWRG